MFQISRRIMLIYAFQIVFVFVSSYERDDETDELSQHLIKHGDAAKDVAFQVEDLDAIMKVAKDRGAIVVRDIWEESDKDGVVRCATVKTVRRLENYLLHKILYVIFFLSTGIPHILLLTARSIMESFCPTLCLIIIRTTQLLSCCRK